MMTPERKEEIKRDAQSGKGYEDAFILNQEVLELLAALEEAQQQKDDAKSELEELKNIHQRLRRSYELLDSKLAEAQKEAQLAYAAYVDLQGYCVSRGEYDSLLNKHSVLARAHREAQQTIARLTAALIVERDDALTWEGIGTVNRINKALGETQP